MSSNNIDFIRQPNVQLLWEIISEQLVLNSKPEKIRKDIYNVLTQNIRNFYTNENEKIGSLVGLNKKYIAVLVQYINTNYSKIETNNKTSNFEQELKQKQTEFNQLMTLQVPPIPNFRDDANDSPMTEMEVAIKKASDMRNYDLEVINASRQAPAQLSNNLKATPSQIRISENLDSRVLNKDIINLNFDVSKNIKFGSKNNRITWADHDTLLKEVATDEVDALFQKLKKVEGVTPFVEVIDRIQVLESKIDLILQLLKDYKSVFSNESTSSSL
jgi:hypothetical protein